MFILIIHFDLTQKPYNYTSMTLTKGLLESRVKEAKSPLPSFSYLWTVILVHNLLTSKHRFLT